MSDNTGFKSIAESNDDIQEIDSGSYGKVYRASWKNSQGYLALKSFYDLNNTIAKEIIHEFKLQHQVNFHNNIIRFCGIIISYEENQVDNSKYLLVIEYADSGTLRSYLKQHFENLTWTDKFELALQLSSAVLCLHDQGIAHRDLHSNNVLIHQSVIKEAPISDTPEDYIKLYTDCWNSEPDNLISYPKFWQDKHRRNGTYNIYRTC
ncbi:unnamed protein product [Rhizophagus irregularis]|nr:unnamed protein product [Rhizophagus irregularis]